MLTTSTSTTGSGYLVGPGTLTNSFCLDNVNNPGARYECVYEGQGSVTLDHNTLLTAHNQTAAIYLSTDFGPLGTVKVTDNLLAGGSYTLYGGATSAAGVSSETVTGNRFSDCLPRWRLLRPRRIHAKQLRLVRQPLGRHRTNRLALDMALRLVVRARRIAFRTPVRWRQTVPTSLTTVRVVSGTPRSASVEVLRWRLGSRG